MFSRVNLNNSVYAKTHTHQQKSQKLPIFQNYKYKIIRNTLSNNPTEITQNNDNHSQQTNLNSKNHAMKFNNKLNDMNVNQPMYMPPFTGKTVPVI